MPRLGRGIRPGLQAGMAITIEPGVYLQEFGGIRIEDTVVGHAERVRDPHSDLQGTAGNLSRRSAV